MNTDTDYKRYMGEHDLYFTAPEFKQGMSVTVRKGIKWADTAKVGDGLNLLDERGLYNHGMAIVMGISYIQYGYIPVQWLWLQDKPFIDKFSRDEYVTVLFYKIF